MHSELIKFIESKGFCCIGAKKALRENKIHHINIDKLDSFSINYLYEKLKITGDFEKIKKAIRKSDTRIQGSINPHLSDLGDKSEAPQY